MDAAPFAELDDPRAVLRRLFALPEGEREAALDAAAARIEELALAAHEAEEAERFRASCELMESVIRDHGAEIRRRAAEIQRRIDEAA